MNLTELAPHVRSRLERDYRQSGMLVLPGVRLPPGFRPRTSELVFLAEEGACEVYLDAEVRYRGPNPAWRAVVGGPVQPGGARRLLGGQPSFSAAVATLIRAFGEAERRPQGAAREQQVEAGDEGVGLTDLVARARERVGEVVFVGRDAELRALETNLLRETKPGVVVVGPAGVGKSTLVHMLAHRIALDEGLPPGLADTPIYDLQLGGVLEGVRAMGDLERSVRTLIEQPGRPIFFIDELHQIIRPELAPLRDLLKPALAEGGLRVIGASTVVEWSRVRDTAFRRRFMELRLDEPSPEETHRMLGPRIERLATHHGFAFPERTVREAVVMADRYLPSRSFPDKAIDLLDHAAALQRSAPRRSAAARLERRHLLEAVSAQSGLPSFLIDPSSADAAPDRTVAAIKRQLRGQDASLDELGATLASRIAQRMVGWGHALESLQTSWDRRPLACVLAFGPTGVGKTETAKLIAHAFYEGRIIMLNGSDVGPEARHGVSMWTGSPPGYVGSDQGGVLTTGLRTHGTAVILIDELEKASIEAVQNVLLPLLGEGVVTDRNTGESLSAADCVVFCTSNLQPAPSEPRGGGLGFGARGADGPAVEDPRSMLRGALRPEILGRFHTLLSYQPLEIETAWRVFEDRLGALQEQVGGGARIALDPEAQAWVRTRLEANQSGARGIQDLVRERVLPLIVGAGPGQRVELTVREGVLAPVAAERPLQRLECP